MSYKNKLLHGIEVEWKRLGEIAIFSNGKGHEKEITEDGKFVVVNSKFISTSGKVVKYSNRQICPLFVDDILIVMSDLPNGKALARTFLVDQNDRYTLNQRIGGITIKTTTTLLPKFLNYYLNRTQQLTKFDNGIDQTNLQKQQILDVSIPILPVEVQKDIVRILETFTEHTTKLIAELNTELTARKKQHSYYRDKLLSFDEGDVEWKPLGEVGELIRGNGLPKTDFTETGVPAIHYGQIYTYYGTQTDKTISFVSTETAKKLRKVKHGDVVITNTSENLEDVGKAVLYLGEEQAVTGGHATIFKPSKDISGKFFAYFTQSIHFSNQKRRYAKGTKVIDVSATDMAKIIVPIPSIEQQERIVTILDKLDILNSAITKGLPKEIELRKKQYEYYRGLLLTFPKNNIES